MALTEGIESPNFAFSTNDGKTQELNDIKDKFIVLYFYPKDNTSGCTKEACYFRDNMVRLTGLGAVVLGVSPDSEKSHENFKEKYNLNFTLIPDTSKEICNKYDIIGEKSLYGKKFTGVIRTTYLIGTDKIIKKVFSKVKVEGHVDEVIKHLNELSK